MHMPCMFTIYSPARGGSVHCRHDEPRHPPHRRTVKMPRLAAAHVATHRSSRPARLLRAATTLGPRGAPLPLGCRRQGAPGPAQRCRFCPPLNLAGMNTRSREVDTIWSGRSSSQAESSTVLVGGVMTYQLGNASGLWSPTALAVWDVGGDFALLVADTDNHRIVRLTPPPLLEADEAEEGAPLRMWTLSHFAGSGRRGMENGGAYMASFRYPHAIAVCMDSSAQARERRLSEAAMEDEGEEAEVVDPAVAALQGVTVLVADTGNHVIRLVRAQDTALLAVGESSWGAAAQVETLAGDGTPGSEDSLTKREKPKASVLLSSVLTARFALPQGVDCDGKGGALVADTYNQAVRHVGTGGITVTLAGGERNGNADGGGTAAEFSEPVGAACRTTLREPGALFTHACSPINTSLPPYGHHPATL